MLNEGRGLLHGHQRGLLLATREDFYMATDKLPRSSPKRERGSLSRPSPSCRRWRRRSTCSRASRPRTQQQRSVRKPSWISPRRHDWLSAG